MSEGERKTVVGVWSKMPEERNGWKQFEVDVGSQYPVRVATKLEHLIEEAMALRDQEATWTYTESEARNPDGTPRINPNSGKPYTDRRLEKVEAGAHATSTDGASSSTASGRTVVSDDERQRLIIRQSTLNRSVDLYVGTRPVGMPIELLADEEREALLGKVFETAGRFERWVYRGTSLEEDFPAD